ncbi:MAG: YitT family protein [Bacteroidales bacterium]|jgi:uncharacterized membrane-anchored protein YitT (DUF2179 family)|nr:YitT family protein [Bacteroidales bacterium]
MTKNQKIWREIRNYFMIFVGLAIFSFGWTAFMIPSHLTGGGASGIGTVFYFATGFPVGITAMIINLVLVLIAWKVLGTRFCINTAICTAMISLMLYVGQLYFTEPLVPDDVFMSSIIGSALAAFGVGIALNFGGNTGGTDIVALMIGKYRNISYGRVTLYTNILIIASSYFVPGGSMKTLVYSMIGMFVYIYVSDLVIEGYRQSFQYFVFSLKNQEIADAINVRLGRGATFFKAYGSFTKEEKDVLMIIAHRTDRSEIIKIIKDIDDEAFISVGKTSSVFGKNFDRIKI